MFGGWELKEIEIHEHGKCQQCIAEKLWRKTWI